MERKFVEEVKKNIYKKLKVRKEGQKFIQNQRKETTKFSKK